MKKLLFVLLLIFSTGSSAEIVQLEKRFALKVLVASYVNGFKEFDTTVVGFDDSVSVGIYVERDGQTRENAEILANRFREQIPKLLELNAWAKDIKVVVTIY
jgi:hypothetical protein